MKNRLRVIPSLLVFIAALKWLPIDELFHLMRIVPAKTIHVGTEVSMIEREGAKILLRSSRNSNGENNDGFKNRTITVFELPQPKVKLSGNRIDKNHNEIMRYLKEHGN